MSMVRYRVKTGSREGLSKFERFLLAEYSNIAQAHFTAIGTISAFFKHYLFIVSLPLSALAILFGSAFRNDTSLINRLSVPTVLVWGLTVAIWLVGLCVMAYTINLRLEALLYARTVNGIRRYFAERSRFERVSKYLVLPRVTNKPEYIEAVAFGPVVGAFALLNTSFPLVGFWWYASRTPKWTATTTAHAWGILVLSGLIHLVVYRGMAANWAHRYGAPGIPSRAKERGPHARKRTSLTPY